VKDKKIMWILNITPDSFYDGWKYNIENVKQVIEKMIEQGVDIIDVWWFSSRPWLIMPSVTEELSRILPILDILDKYDIPFSVDTCRNEVVEKILKYKNLAYINDISWLKDEKILDLISSTKIWYILMHIKWEPKNMQNNPDYEDIIWEIHDFFTEKLKIINSKWVTDVILDPWFWFWKTLSHNYIILNNLKKFKDLGYELLAWLSRKSMIWKLLDSSPDKILTETVALNILALQNGADILRVHDIKENKNILKIYNFLSSKKSNDKDI